MSQETSKPQEIEKDVSTLNYSTKYVWQFRDHESIDYFLSLEDNSTISSEIFSMKIEGNTTLKWILNCLPTKTTSKYPNGYTNVFLQCCRLPNTINKSITSITADYTIEIPKLFYHYNYTAIFTKDDAAWGLPTNQLHLDQFKKLNVLKNGGFDIICHIEILKINYIPVKINKNLNIGENNKLSNVVNNIDSTTMFQQILQELQIMNQRLNKIENTINNENEEEKFDDFDKLMENKDKIKPKIIYLKQWILTVFNGQNDLVAKYSDIIINKEGFDDISTFVNLCDVELQDIGIDKKAHRMKFLNGFKKYKMSITNELEGQIDNDP